MKYYIADLHFYHKNIIKYENRPFSSIEEMNEHMISEWNKKVKEKDEVYILGDFAFTNGENANKLLKRLNGKKYLIIGNHDSFLKDKTFDRNLFENIYHYYSMHDGDKFVVLFHYPIAVWDKQHYGAIHLYGHVHSGLDAEGTQRHPILPMLENAYNVGVDVIGYAPMTLREILYYNKK